MATYNSFSSYNPSIAIDFIRNEEGCKLKAYLCPAGKWTIGYGHTAGVTAPETNISVREYPVVDHCAVMFGNPASIVVLMAETAPIGKRPE